MLAKTKATHLPPHHRHLTHRSTVVESVKSQPRYSLKVFDSLGFVRSARVFGQIRQRCCLVQPFVRNNSHFIPFQTIFSCIKYTHPHIFAYTLQQQTAPKCDLHTPIHTHIFPILITHIVRVRERNCSICTK